MDVLLCERNLNKPLMLFLSIQNPGENEPWGGRQISSEDTGWLAGAPPAWQDPGADLVSAQKGKTLENLLVKTLCLADFSFGLCSPASACHGESAGMARRELSSMDLFNLRLFFLYGKPVCFPFLLVFKGGQYSGLSLRSVSF